MRIVYLVTRSDAVGGATVHVRDLSLAMLARGHMVTVLVGGKGPVTEDLAEKGIPFHVLQHLVGPLDPLQDVLALIEIRRVLQTLRPDFLSTHSSKAGVVGRLAGWSLGIPVIFTAHGWAFGTKTLGFYRCAERLAGLFARRIITVSEYDRQLALRYRIVPEWKLVTVHNGMPDIPVAWWGKPERQPPRLIMVARFEDPKDHATLFQALTTLTESVWSLDLIGDGPLQAQMEGLASRLGLAGRVRFLGMRRDVAEQLAQSQLFLLVSNWEGFPRSILEAMRAGLPVLASDVGGVREAVVEGETGFLVPRGDVASLHRRLKDLLGSPQLRTEMGQAGRRRYAENFTFDRMLDATVSVYNQILGITQR